MKIKWKITFNSAAVLGFSLICLIATLLGIATKGALTEKFFMTYHSRWTDPLTYLRFVTHVFGHASWEHFIANVSYILLLGPLLEEKYGTKTLIQMIAITAVITAVINYIFFPHIALCGSSGVVFAFILLASFTSFRQGEIPLTFILVAVIYLGYQVAQGLTVKDNISNMAHIIGGIVGAVIGYLLNQKKGKSY
ncbi:MAG: rhomboid family intramembrane serine protease [Lachnospiraceae bacterium]|nr:rhomboid family intramembrane serine protease [Lachnospiraceae bacterium]